MAAGGNSGVVTEGEEIVVFLDADDDVAAIRAKLERVRGHRIALVVSPSSQALRRGLALKVLRRVAEGMAVDLSIVTADAEIQRIATEEDVRVFNSVRGFRRYTQRMENEPRSVPMLARYDRSSRLAIRLGLILAAFFSAAIAAFVAVPAAQVTLKPATEPIGETIEIRADPQARAIDFVGRRVPARALYDKVEGTDQVPVTGVGQSGAARAEGRVTFTNRSRAEIAIPPGSIVLTPEGVKFTVTEVANLAPALGAWARANVRAVDPGPKGDVARGRISQIEGPLTQQVAVFNEEPTASAGPGDMGVVSDSDRKRLRDGLFDRLAGEAQVKLRAAVRPGETLPPQTVQLTVLEENYDRKAGEQARAVNLRMVVRINGTAFDANDVQTLAERAWQPRLRAGFTIAADSVRVLPPEVGRVDADVAVLRVRVDGVAAAVVNEELATNAVRWRRASEAAAQLAGDFVLAEEPSVVIAPSWANRAFRVHISIKSQ